MTCHVCGSHLSSIYTDIPIKTGERSIVIFKNLPVLQCDNCREYLIEDSVMEQVETFLENSDRNMELQIVPFAA